MNIGKIRTKETCPICHDPYPLVTDYKIGLECPEHKTRPRRFFIDIQWSGRQQKIYSDANNQVLSSWDQAYLCLALINKELKAGLFDPSKYFRKDKSKFWTMKLLDDFLDWKKDDLAPTTRKNYRTMAEEAKAFFKNQDVREILELDAQLYMKHLKKTGKKGKTLKCYLDFLRCFLAHCRKPLRIVDRVPDMPEIEVPEASFRWLEAKDQQKIWIHIPPVDRPIFDFMALHGVRPSEARAVKIQDVDLIHQFITIRSTWSGRELRDKRKGKGAKPVVVPIHPEIAEFVAGRAEKTLPGAFLFVNPRTDRVYSENRLRKVWNRVRSKAGLDKQLKLKDATRHSFASQLVNAGEGLDRVRDLLGHTNSRTTQRYAHHSLAAKRAALNKLSLRKVVDITDSIPGLSLEAEALKKQ